MEHNMHPKRIRHATKVCKVCEDGALGYNFGVITCESCKAFFRRNGGDLTGLRCRKFGNCPINVSTRRRCAKCRMTKCLSLGMKSETADSDGEKREKMDVESVNFNQTLQSTTPMMTDQSMFTSQSSEYSLKSRRESGYGSQVLTILPENANLAESQVYEQFCQCKCSCQCGSTGVSKQLEEIRTALAESQTNSCVLERTGQHFTASQSDELLRAEVFLKSPVLKSHDVDGVLNRVMLYNLDGLSMLRGSDMNARSLVECVKQLSFFRSLSRSAQMHLLNRNLLGMLTLHSRWDMATNALIPYAGDSNQVIIPADVYDVFIRKFLSTFDPQLMSDWRLMLLLMIVKLYESDVNVNFLQTLRSFTDDIDRELKFYIKMMHNHITTHYDSSCRSTYLMTMLMEKLKQVRSVDTLYFAVASHFSWENVPPLLAEVMINQSKLTCLDL